METCYSQLYLRVKSPSSTQENKYLGLSLSTDFEEQERVPGWPGLEP